MQWILIALIVALLSACQAIQPYWPANVDTSELSLTVTQPFTLPARRLSLSLQDGKFDRYRNMDVYVPSCTLVFSESQRQDLTVEKQSCRVTGRRLESNVVDSGSIQVATVKLIASMGIIAEEYITHFDLSCPANSTFIQMHCQFWDDSTSGRHLTKEQIQFALGDYLRID